jgi:hypothetical protein
MTARLFVIKHNCGSAIIIDSSKFIPKDKENKAESLCPSCKNRIFYNDNLSDFIAAYNKIDKELKGEEYPSTIKEIDRDTFNKFIDSHADSMP